MAPGDRVNGPQFNQQLSAISPGILNESIRLAGGDYLMIADMDRRHPVLLPLDTEWGVRFEGYWSVEAQADADTLMQFDNGSPALLERVVGQGRVMMVASSLDTEWNNLPLQGLYLPFIHESLRYLAQASMKERAYRIGDVIDLTSAVAEDAAITVVTPAGEESVLGAGERTLTASSIGFLRIEAEGEPQFYAVNADPEESVLEKLAPSALQDLITNPDTEPQQTAEVRTAQLVAELEGPQRVWWWLLILVVLMLLAETRIANTTYR